MLHYSQYVLLCFLLAHGCDTRVHQAAKDTSADYDALVNVLELIKQFLKHLYVYTTIAPTPSMDEIVVMTTVELLAILALATKELMQGQLGASALPEFLPYLMRRSELRKKASRRRGRRGNPTEARSTRPAGSSDERIADSRGDLRPRSEHEGCYGW